MANPIGMCSDMIKLAKIWEKVSEYPQMKVLLKFNENTKLFLASYFFRFNDDDIKEEIIAPVLECLLRLFSLLELVDVDEGIARVDERLRRLFFAEPDDLF